MGEYINAPGFYQNENRVDLGIYIVIGVVGFIISVIVILYIMSTQNTGGFFPSKTNKFSASINNHVSTTKNATSPCAGGK